MKKVLFFILFLITFSAFSQKDTVIHISNGWTFSYGKDSKQYDATVPGSIYTDLIKNTLIENPFYSNNELKVQWVGDSAWYYKNSLNISPDIMLNQHIEICFEGLDTYAKVWVNDTLILNTNNMFRVWRKDIKQLLKAGKNEIKIEFKPVSEYAKAEAAKLNYKLSDEERVFVRKAQYQFGWDFAPKLKGCAIWRPVKLIAWNDYKVESVQIVQKQITQKQAVLAAILEIESKSNSEITVRISDNKTGKVFNSKKVLLKKGNQKIKTDFTIDNPKLWWCNGMGEPFLYSISVRTKDNKGQSKKTNVSVGIRTIELVQQKDELGKSFYFKLNGIKVFAKGSNYIPANYFSSVNDTVFYSRIINDAVKSNMNMLRVWGGGIYEADDFYNLCDKNGIMVWQDFMFACAMYPGDKIFVDNFKQEAIDNVKRLRNHPSIAIWCGNNEISEGWHNWGWQKQYRYTKEDSLKIWNDYQYLFDKVLQDVITVYDSARNYWQSSPEIGWGKKESLLQGDCHYWGIWWGNEPFKNYNTKVGRFMSEYGFQGMPCMNSIKQFCDTSELNVSSTTMKSHQKHPVGYQTIQEYIKTEYPKPTNFEDFIYKSQLTQADGIRTAIEAHRREMPYCMGTLNWQMNDCWPAVSWSGIDYYGKWKAMQYVVKNAYENQILSIIQKTDSVFIYAISDELTSTKNNVLIKLMTFDGTLLFNKELLVDIPAQSSIVIFKIKQSELINDSLKNSVVLSAWYKNNFKQRRAIYYFDKFNKLNLNAPVFIETNFKVYNNEFDVIVRANYLTKGFCLNFDGNEDVFSDNYFDLLPNEMYVIHCKVNSTNDEIHRKLKYKYLTK
ncbi:MAG: glycoside hydrolase family 2 protein [Bacteroidia bacterium]|nr:glycoside hydrolase family 2 protein [Bacteroidia bacterium]